MSDKQRKFFVESTLKKDNLPFCFNVKRIIAFYPYETNDPKDKGTVIHFNDQYQEVICMEYEMFQACLDSLGYLKKKTYKDVYAKKKRNPY